MEMKVISVIGTLPYLPRAGIVVIGYKWRKDNAAKGICHDRC